MTEQTDWEKSNTDYLSAALAWLRLRLERQARRESDHCAPIGAASVTTASPLPEPSIFARFFGQKSAAQQARPVGLLLPANESGAGEQIAQAAATMEMAAKSDPPPALIILSQRFGLSRFERDVLLLCAAIELDTGASTLCGLAQGNSNRSYPTFALAMTIFDEPEWEASSPERPLRYWRLIEINQPGAQPLVTSALRADERIVNYLKGLNHLDDRLTPLLAPFAPIAPAGAVTQLPASQQSTVETIVHRLEQTTQTQRLPIVQLLGGDSSSKQIIAWHAASAVSLHVYRLPAEWLPSHAAELETFARLLSRESILSPVAFYLDAHEVERAGSEAAGASQSPPLQRFLARSSGLFFLDTRDVRPDVGREAVALDIAKPTPAEQQAAWRHALGRAAGDSPALLASQFNLGIAEIERIAQAAAPKVSVSLADAAGDDGQSPHRRLWDACLATTRPRLEALAQRLEPKAMWDDIVLPPHEMTLLDQIAAQVGQRLKVYEEWGFGRKMNRGLGINALFTGDSGTGKTMAAEVIANELRLNLYRIDLSAVVSKYIGETEKNLRKLFDAAEDGGAILFFDEADALFGKRSEVRDSHDRYANIEINYLLQRMESYRGLAILATNMKSALDQAFTRRLRFIVNFPFPGATQRKDIWERVFPAETETKGLDFGRLARLNLTGGSIHNVALNAAFLAAKAGKPVRMQFILEAARAEFGKLERTFNEADFYWNEPDEEEQEMVQTQ
jgi:ATPase family associated with various cellular activities (AAA)/Winged helix domain, variant